MAERRIKFRLFTYYEEGEDYAGNPRLREKTAAFGELVDIERDEDLNRGEDLGAFFTEEEEEQIQAGTYAGPEADNLRGLGLALSADAAMVEDAGAGMPGFDAASASASELAAHIIDNKLGVGETVALAGDDPELAEKVLDAEAQVAAINSADPRAGVEKGAQAIIDKAAQADNEGN